MKFVSSKPGPFAPDDGVANSCARDVADYPFVDHVRFCGDDADHF